MEFDLLADLPRGVTVLEASAGTGKTYTIEGLVARYVAERLPLRKLLVVTFTRAATAELRDRVRTRMVRVAEHLGAVIDGASPKSDDEVAAFLGGGLFAVPPEVVRERHRRLAEALSDFDAATISTIHGFCQQVLAGVGLTGDMDRQATLIEDERDVIDAVVDDVLVERFAGVEGDEVVARNALRAIAKALIDNPDAALIPRASEEPEVAIRIELGDRVRKEVERRKRAFRLLSYNDLLVRLRDTLLGVGGEAARERLRSQYDVALIDEFQDTDPVQWDILSEVFASDGSSARSLVLIGDPKQAIYSFRGADVYAYLKASRGRDPQTLQTNWRSDQGLLDAYNVVFDGAELGHENIAYLPVSAAKGHEDPRLVGAPVAAPLRIRIARAGDGYHLNRAKMIPAPTARAQVARDVAVQAVQLLSSEAKLIDRGPDGKERSERRRVQPRDIAVLVRSNAEASLVQSELHDAGVPAVINGVGSVFATSAATEWLRLLEALEQPTSVSRARTAALTVFLGWTGEQVAAARVDDRALDPVHESLLSWAAILRDRSVASLLQTMVAQENLPKRVLGTPDGERAMTDLEHVAEQLHAAAIGEELGPSALTGWLRERIAEASDDLHAEERARRLESDAEAVQVLTVHRSKGLEYPVVFAPFLWSSNVRAPAVPVFHDEQRDGERSADVGGQKAPGFGEHVDLHKDEAKGEELRLVYVALTRARHQAVVWWLPAAFAEQAPLSRLLLCRSSQTGRVLNAGKFRLKNDDLTRADLDMLAERTGGKMVVEDIPYAIPRPTWNRESQDPAVLDAAAFDRDLDLRWRRTSYSAITRAVHDEPRVGSEPDVEFTDDEALAPPAVVEVAADGEVAADLESSLRAVALPLAGMPGGVDVGTFVHGVFEDAEFTHPDLREHLGEVVAARRDKREVDLGDAEVFLDGLTRVFSTPLGPLAGDVRLLDIGPQDRLLELDFELPLVGGAAGRRERLAVAAIGRLLREHLADDDPLRAYAEKLFDRAFAKDLQGYLAGSIDAVLRIDGRYLVVDYKTNWLGAPDEELSAWHYRPDALVSAMERGHYPLQALLYAVALHRYLRWRVAGYSAETHLGGVLYLFVRGMIGEATPVVDGVPCGVFSWQPPAALVAALSDLMDEGEVAA